TIILTLQNFVSIPAGVGKPESLFRDDWHERINDYIRQWTTSRGLNTSDLSRAQKKELVCALAEDGAFGGKNAAGYISRLLGMAVRPCTTTSTVARRKSPNPETGAEARRGRDADLGGDGTPGRGPCPIALTCP